MLVTLNEEYALGEFIIIGTEEEKAYFVEFNTCVNNPDPGLFEMLSDEEDALASADIKKALEGLDKLKEKMDQMADMSVIEIAYEIITK